MSRHLIAEVKPSASIDRKIRVMAAGEAAAMLQPHLNRRQGMVNDDWSCQHLDLK
jgi:hypothetical protein